MASGKNYMLNDNFPKHIKNATSTSDGLMSAVDKSRIDGLFEFGLLAPATPDKDGIMTKEDKTKLDGIEENANNYIHPDDENTRHVTDEQISYWNNKASTDISTQLSNGLMSLDDKKKLDNIEVNANNYTHPNDENTRHVSDEQILRWDNKASTDVANQSTGGLMSAIDKTKLDGIEENANNYVHPETHPATMIVEDSTHRFVTDNKIEYWDDKASTDVVNQEEDGLMSSYDKIKLDAIEENANNYTHPETHPATMIEEDETHRFVTDEQILQWDSGIEITDIPTVNQSTDGLMSKEDKKKLDDLEPHPETHPATMIEEDETHRFVTDQQILQWNSGIEVTDIPIADQEQDGLMSSDDKIKLDGIEENANNYVHPETHPATMIVEDSTHRFVTDEQIEEWNSGIEVTDIPKATQSQDGLMSKEDKTLLDDLIAKVEQLEAKLKTAVFYK